MSDHEDTRTPDEAPWDDDGDRTIATPFEPPEDLPPARSPISDAPAPLGQPGTAPLAFGVLASDLPPPPSVPPVPPSRPDVVVGSGATGDEATLAVSAPDVSGNPIAAALAATLGGPPAPPPPHRPPPPSGHSPAAMTFAGHPAPPPSRPGGYVAAPPHPQPHPQAHPHPPPSGGWPVPPPGFVPPPPPPVAGPPSHLRAPVAPPAKAAVPNAVALAVFAGICIVIFLVGVALFVRTNF